MSGSIYTVVNANWVTIDDWRHDPTAVIVGWWVNVLISRRSWSVFVVVSSAGRRANINST